MRAALALVAAVWAALAAAALAAWVRGQAAPPTGRFARETRMVHVPEDAGAPLAAVAIHYTPVAERATQVAYRQLLAALPAQVEVHVVVSARADFDRFLTGLRAASVPHLERLHPVVTGTPITTWARDRFASAQDGDSWRILAPPWIEEAYEGRAGDWLAPFVVSRSLGAGEPRVAGFVFEGGDLASTRRFLFVDVNLLQRGAGRSLLDRDAVEAELGLHFAQKVVWLGERPGDVPRHHILMYMAPIDDATVAVGDPRLGAELYAREPAHGLDPDPDLDGHAARFDRAAADLEAQGFRVIRFPVVVLSGAASWVTYTNAVFDRTAAGRPRVYLPQYGLPTLDDAARRQYEELGYEVTPIDVTAFYRFNGSLGCLVNVLRRAPT